MQRSNFISNQNFNNITSLPKKKKVTSNQFKPTVLNQPIDNVIKELTKKFNINISIKSVQKDTQSVSRERMFNNLGTGSVPVVIAPSVLNEMANNPKEKEYVEKTIKDFFDQQPAIDSSLSAKGKKAIQSVIVFHADGSWTESGGSLPTTENLLKLKKEETTKQKNKLKQAYTEFYYKTSDQRNLENSSNNNLLNQSMDNLFKSSLNGMDNFDKSGAMNNLMAFSLYKAYSKFHSKNPNPNSLPNSNNIAMDYLSNQLLSRGY